MIDTIAEKILKLFLPFFLIANTIKLLINEIIEKHR